MIFTSPIDSLTLMAFLFGFGWYFIPKKFSRKLPREQFQLNIIGPVSFIFLGGFTALAHGISDRTVSQIIRSAVTAGENVSSSDAASNILSRLYYL